MITIKKLKLKEQKVWSLIRNFIYNYPFAFAYLVLIALLFFSMFTTIILILAAVGGGVIESNNEESFKAGNITFEEYANVSLVVDVADMIYIFMIFVIKAFILLVLAMLGYFGIRQYLIYKRDNL